MVTTNSDLDLRYDIECDVLYYNPTWRILWVQSGERGEYADPGSVPLPMRSGDRVRFRGTLTAPVNELKFAGATTEIIGKVVTTPRPLPPEAVDLNLYRNALVTFEAWVDKQDQIDAGVLRLTLSQQGRAVFALVSLGDVVVVDALVDRRVRVTGVFAPRIDPMGNLTELQVMVPGPEGIEAIGSVADDPRFDAPLRLIEELPSRPIGELVRLSGEVINQNVGHFITLRDLSGQITLRTPQIRYLNVGETVEVVGTISAVTASPSLTAVSFRKRSIAPTNRTAASAASRRLLNLAARVRELPDAETNAGHVVNLRGVVTWSHPASSRFYLADSSGGIAIERSPDSPFFGPGAMLDVRGAVEPGDFAPIVRASQIFPIGTIAYPQPKPTDLEHALAGVEDAQWVAMQGFVFNTSLADGICTLDVATNQGDFKIRVPTASSLKKLPYAVVEAQGVCATQVQGDGQLQRIELWVPEDTLITALENAPADPFAQPELPLSRLGRFNPGREIKDFVKVSGTVLFHHPDHWLYLANEDQVLRIHTRDPALQPSGRQLEVAGRLGRDRGGIVLREAMLRTTGTGRLPAVRPIDAATDDLPAFEGHLIAVTGTLINRLVTADHLRLTLQNQGTIFDADLSAAHSDRGDDTLPAIGAQLRLTGVLVPALGTAALNSGFSLRLRTIDDIDVLSPAPWWTPRRLTAVTVSLLLAVGMGFLWVHVLRRRVQEQTAQITAQLAREARMTEQLQHATRLESLGVLAGGIAHDFNNLLTVVLGNLSLLRLDTAPGSPTDHSLSDAERAVGRAKQLTMQLLTFAKGGSPVRHAEDLPGIVREVAQFATHGSNVRCVLHLAGDAWPAHVDKGQIGQVVQNLVINALQAMPDGGTLTLRLVNELTTVERPAHLPPGPYLRLAITDTGCGIPAARIPRIFDPYFSTKKEGHGLGLATVYSVVRKHHGDVQVQSVEGRGTTFTIWLPAAEESRAASVPPKTQRIPRGEGQHIIVMDDEADIRALALKMLHQLGYQATGVADGVEGIATYQRTRGTDQARAAVILDLTIRGGMGGVETLARLRKLDPGVKAIASSGYSSDQTIAAHQEHGFDGLIPKPYDIAQFARALHRTLHNPPPGR